MVENTFNIPPPRRQTGSLARFVHNNAFDVRHGRFKALTLKIVVGLGMLLAVIPLIVVRLVKPIALIRFARLYSDRINPLVTAPEIYLCEIDAGIHNKIAVDIFYNQRYVANQQVNKMWKRALTITPLAEPIDRLNRLVPGGKDHEVPWSPARKSRDTYGLMADTAPHVSFTKKEEENGQIGLRNLGVPEGVDFICFHSRDSSYMATTFGTGKTDESDYRNSRIDDYLQAVEAMTELGYYAIRMGAIVEDSLKTANPRIIDYASVGRTAFMDVYLLTHCRFFLGGNAGIYALAEWFRRPVIHANFVPILMFYAANPYDLTILKKLWLRSENRYLTYREILGSYLSDARNSSQYVEAGIEIVNNCPAEITSVALEMEQRINGTWVSEAGDEDLQRQFWSLWKPEQGPYRTGPGLDSWAKGIYRARVGTKFLRDNQDLLA